MKNALIWTCMLGVAAVLGACSSDDLGRSMAAHSQADSGPPPEPDAGPPPDRGCTLTQGYWKNHPEDWPVTSLTIGTRSYTQAELLDLLNTPPRGDASVILAHQLIAALLNQASGASGTSAIASAQSWMTFFDPGHDLPYGIRAGSPAGRRGTAIADMLADYNEGTDGPGHCDDEPSESLEPSDRIF